MSVLPSKYEVREAMRVERACQEPGRVTDRSLKIAERVVQMPEFQRAGVVGAYLALPGEVEVHRIMGAALRAGKRVAVPARRLDGEYMPAWWGPDEPLTRGHFGVMQPVLPQWARPESFGLMVIPGVAFTRTGDRLGHGRGYYDRMLARLGPRVVFRVGVAFEWQLAGGWPVSPDDVGMDAVVTEAALYRKTRGERQDRSVGRQEEQT